VPDAGDNDEDRNDDDVMMTMMLSRDRNRTECKPVRFKAGSSGVCQKSCNI